jgi:hypothetical protein
VQSGDDDVRVRDVVVEYRNGGSNPERRPVRHPKSDVLIVIQDGDLDLARHRHVVPAWMPVNRCGF